MTASRGDIGSIIIILIPISSEVIAVGAMSPPERSEGNGRDGCGGGCCHRAEWRAVLCCLPDSYSQTTEGTGETRFKSRRVHYDPAYLAVAFTVRSLRSLCVCFRGGRGPDSLLTLDHNYIQRDFTATFVICSGIRRLSLSLLCCGCTHCIVLLVSRVLIFPLIIAGSFP